MRESSLILATAAFAGGFKLRDCCRPNGSGEAVPLGFLRRDWLLASARIGCPICGLVFNHHPTISDWSTAEA